MSHPAALTVTPVSCWLEVRVCFVVNPLLPAGEHARAPLAEIVPSTSVVEITIDWCRKSLSINRSLDMGGSYHEKERANAPHSRFVPSLAPKHTLRTLSHIRFGVFANNALSGALPGAFDLSLSFRDNLDRTPRWCFAYATDDGSSSLGPAFAPRRHMAY